MSRYLLAAVVAYFGWRWWQGRKEAATLEGAGLEFDLGREPLPEVEIEAEWDEATQAAVKAALEDCRARMPDAPLQQVATCAAEAVFPGFPWPPVHGDHPTAWEVWHRLVGPPPATSPPPPLELKVE